MGHLKDFKCVNYTFTERKGKEVNQKKKKKGNE